VPAEECHGKHFQTRGIRFIQRFMRCASRRVILINNFHSLHDERTIPLHVPEAGWKFNANIHLVIRCSATLVFIGRSAETRRMLSHLPIDFVVRIVALGAKFVVPRVCATIRRRVSHYYTRVFTGIIEFNRNSSNYVSIRMQSAFVKSAIDLVANRRATPE